MTCAGSSKRWICPLTWLTRCCSQHGPVFQDARTPAGFAAVAVDHETGTVIWPGGADLAPDTLYERIRTGAWPDQHVAA
jgi:uncharacterized protein DUF2442